jgi:hypothetical protein
MEEFKFGWYKHFKGNYYFAVDLATHSETNETMVIYKDKEKQWTRPLAMFTEIMPNGKPRFEFIEEGTLTEKLKQTTYICEIEDCNGEVISKGYDLGNKFTHYCKKCKKEYKFENIDPYLQYKQIG